MATTFEVVLDRMLERRRYIWGDILKAIELGDITDVGYCFDSTSTVQFCMGSVVIRANIGHGSDFVSVTYGKTVLSRYGKRAICAELRKYLDSHRKPLPEVRVPPDMWRKKNWFGLHGYEWHRAMHPLSLLNPVSVLFDEKSYNRPITPKQQLSGI